MKIFVTGGTSFLGSALVARLLSRSHEVIALVKDLDEAEKHIDPAAKLVTGNIQQPESYSKYLLGCDVVINADHFKEKKPFKFLRRSQHTPEMCTTNRLAVFALLDLCVENNIKTLVHVSTSAVFNGNGDDETMPLHERCKNKTLKARVQVQKAIEQWIDCQKQDPLKIVSVFPSSVAGPGDNRPTTLGHSILKTAQGRKRTCPPGAINIVDVRDAAAIILAASELGDHGERFIASADFTKMEKLLEIVTDTANVKRTPRRLPYVLAWIDAYISEIIANIKRKPPTSKRDMINTLKTVSPKSGFKASTKLNVSYRPIKETVSDEIDWFRSLNMM